MARLGLVVGIAASVAVHAGAAAALVSLASVSLPARATSVPLEMVEAPVPPPPPAPPPPENAAPPPRPKPRPKPRPRPKPVVVPVEEVVVPDAGVPDAADAGPMVASGWDAGVPGTPVDPGVVDLRPFVPAEERVILLLRADRLRGTPWAERLEALLAPMPDYRSFIEGSGLSIAGSFDTVLIASSDPRDVAQTFLAARSPHDPALLARRPRAPGDPRTIGSPIPGWMLLARPELVPGDWLARLDAIEAQTGDGPTLAVVTVAAAGPTLALPLPGVPPLPAPERMTMALSLDPQGLIVTGAAVFPVEADAERFVAGLETARAGLLASLTGRLVLRSLHAEGAVRRLALARDHGFVTFSTSVSTNEAELLLEQATLMARRFFLRDGVQDR